MNNALKALAIAAALMTPLACYVGAYLAIVRADPMPMMTGCEPWIRIPHYAVGGEAAERFFYPLNVIDRRLRNRYWLYFDDDDITTGAYSTLPQKSFD